MNPVTITLRREGARADVARRGAELRGWHEQGRDLMWDRDPHWWPCSSPILFPIVGRLKDGQTRIGGRSYAMPAHGFAATQDFDVRSIGADEVTLVLSSNDETRALYPFEFELSLRYRLHETGLQLSLQVFNAGDARMPFALGLHPGFRWPFTLPTRERHAIVFDADDSPQVPVVTDDGLLASTRTKLPMTARRLALDSSLFEHDALCFLDAHSRSLRFESPDGAAIVVAARGFAHWALWSKPGAPLLCIEAWTGHADADDFEGEFGDRPSTRWLVPGASSTHGIDLRFTPPRLE